MSESSSPNQSPTEVPPRSIDQLRQLLGVTNIADLTTGETSSPDRNAFLDVDVSVEEQGRWKPVFYAASQSEKGALKVSVTRVESDALIAAGATRVR
jgi:hypothetical protein